MTTSMQAVYRYWTAILFVAVLVQIGAAGYGAFYVDKKATSGADKVTKSQFNHGFSFHDGFGYIILVLSVLLFLFALGARLDRRRVWMALAVPLLVVVQIALAIAGEHVPAIGVLHPLNAFIIAGFTGSLAHRAWRSSAPATATAPP